MKNNNKLPEYIKSIIKKYPNIISGRKNFYQHHIRITKSVEIIKKYFRLKE